MEGRERGMPPAEALLSREKQFEIAEKFFELSEDIGRTVDKMWRLIDSEIFNKHPELSEEAFAIRAEIFRRASDILKISKQVQEQTLKGEREAE